MTFFTGDAFLNDVAMRDRGDEILAALDFALEAGPYLGLGEDGGGRGGVDGGGVGYVYG